MLALFSNTEFSPEGTARRLYEDATIQNLHQFIDDVAAGLVSMFTQVKYARFVGISRKIPILNIKSVNM